MAGAPPRMLLLNGGGHEAFVALPMTYDVSLRLPARSLHPLVWPELILIESCLSCLREVHDPKERCPTLMCGLGHAVDWRVRDFGASIRVSSRHIIYDPVLKLTHCSTDNDSYFYACAQKAVVRLNVVNVGALAVAAKAAEEAAKKTS